MAISATKRKENILGNMTMRVFAVDFDSVTGGEVKTGMNNVIFASYSPVTSDDHGIVYLNSASASATEDDLGSVYIDGVTSNDEGFLFVIGN